jgi:hypothetical protein
LVDWSGNLSWLNGHFSKTFIKNKVKLMLALVTALELAAGVISLVGVFALWFGNDPYWAYMGAFISAEVLLLLFTGQRIAKEYAGASTLAIYFAIAIISLYLLH